MKRCFLLLATFFSLSASFAQLPDLLMSPDTLSKNYPADIDGIVVEINLTNTAAFKRTFTWERITVDMTDGWNSTVCDLITCWSPKVSEGTIEIPAATKVTMLLDVFPEKIVGGAYIKMKLAESTSPDKATIGRYRFATQPVNTAEVEATKLKLYPNPTTEYFVLDGNAPLTEVEIVAMDGKVMRTFPYVQNDIYEVGDLPNGSYMVCLKDENAKRLATKRLQILK
jgi:hypothetical protein